MQFDHDAGQALLPERHEHASSDHGSGLGGGPVGEDHVERHRKRNITILGHRFRGDAVSENSSETGRTEASLYSAAFFGGSIPRYFITICRSFHVSPFWRGSRSRYAG